jgi:lipoprotein-anchoring transpeptidase ErfK/SrfK
LAVVAVAALVLVGFVLTTRGGSSKKVATPPSSTTTSTGDASSSSTPTTAPPPESASIARAKVASVRVYDAPGGKVVKSYANPWFVNGDETLPVPLVFAAVAAPDAQGSSDWVQVLLPTRPNGSSGWVRTADVSVVTTGYRIVVDRASHHLQAFNHGQLMFDDTVAVGAPETPTPAGEYYVIALLKAPNPNGVYGPYAYGLSGHSEVLDSFAGGDAEIGIHGNNDPSVLGTDITHGCVRMSNDLITKLVDVLPLGTPVTIS